MEQKTVFVVTVIWDNGATHKEKFSNENNLQKWLDYKKKTSTAKFQVQEKSEDT